MNKMIAPFYLSIVIYSQIAFNEMNPFPQKVIETKRHFYLSQLAVSDSSNGVISISNLQILLL